MSNRRHRGKIYAIAGGGYLIKFPSHVKFDGKYALVRIGDSNIHVIAKIYRLKNHSSFCYALYISSLEALDIKCEHGSEVEVEVLAVMQ